MPMSRPVIITATIIAFVFSWNNFLWPLIVTDTQLTTYSPPGFANLSSSNYGGRSGILSWPAP